MPRSALLIANGNVPEKLLKKLASRGFDLIIAADGGGYSALQQGVSPDVIIGDLDSFPEEIKLRVSGKLIHRPSQEMNDLEKALIYCREIEVSELTIIGLTGKRLDHAFNNFSVLLRYDRSFKTRIFDADGEIKILRERIEFSGQIGQTVSLIPLVAAEGVLTEGLKYPLRNETLAFGLREGLSNEIVANPVKISLRSGVILLFILGNAND